ncbi:MAG: Abi family protein [Phycisphaeraceae bacterium]|nr:Abi family protein [Phycisphaeraceae bacterium]
MKYDKPPLNFEQQADLLLQRGMIGDKPTIVARLSSTNYYRLSGYWYPFRQRHPTNPAVCLDTFEPGTSFDEVWHRYVFDRHLRLCTMDAIERIEVAVRTQLMYHHAHDHGPFGYATDATSMPKLSASEYAEFQTRIAEENCRSKDTFAVHFRRKYGDTHSALPAWMMTEVMTFGTMLTFYRGCSKKVKNAVSNPFDVPDEVLSSWLLTLNAVRNICAHHGRLWNRELGVKPVVPRIDCYPMWYTPVKVHRDRMFMVLTICKWCLDRIAPQSRWSARLTAHLEGSPALIQFMGFPTNWKQCPIWVPPAAGAGT